jgi:hypothetical protein
MNRLLTLIALLVLLASPVPAGAQTWPQRAQDILNTLNEWYPGRVQDDTGPRLAFNRMFAEQVCFELGTNYGMKTSAGGTLASDVLARHEPFIGWDWEVSHNGSVVQFPPAIDLTGQTFIPVTCTDHLSTGTTPPHGDPPPDTESTPTLGQVLARLDLIAAMVDADARAGETRYLDLSKQHKALADQATAHDTKQGAVVGFLTDGKTITGEVIAVATYLIDHYLIK